MTASLRPFIHNFIFSIKRSLESWILGENDLLPRDGVGKWKSQEDTLLVTYNHCLEQRDHLDEPWRVEGQPYSINPKSDARPRQNFSVWFPVSLQRGFVLFIDRDVSVRNGGQSVQNKKVYLSIPLGDVIYFSTFIRHAGAPATADDNSKKLLNFGIHRYVDFVTGKKTLDRTRLRTRVGIDLDK